MTNALTFMIVDDDADDCEFFHEAISEINPLFKCLTASNGEEALMKLRGEAQPLPDFIFLDLNMQRMDGRKCLAELKKDLNLKDIPVIILTTSASQKDIDETKMLGAFHFMTKPSEYQKLRKEIAFVLSQNKSGHPGITL
ncbi:response regulator [Dyadobacter subterraneus]|uniref:Response regulator n=1 Tax=Dyadobacter subterraneus TaxID=2773304 RepID=A0ABR9WFM2_9BACT|nr:response regulator [Dyadobacter subterraneus]MBE9464306.1 response regulator [Dyadobacter subterraneus]